MHRHILEHINNILEEFKSSLKLRRRDSPQGKCSLSYVLEHSLSDTLKCSLSDALKRSLSYMLECSLGCVFPITLLK